MSRVGSTIGVVGAGSWGTTLAKILGENNQWVLMWAFEKEVCAEINDKHQNSRYVPDVKLPDTVVATNDLQRICESCHLLLVVVPSHVFREVTFEMGNYLNGEQVVVHCTKGIEQETFMRMSEILREETCVRKIGVLSGPNLSRELIQGYPAGTLVASKYDEVVKLAQRALGNQYFRVYGGDDVVGAEVGGAFKNILAVAAGVVDGLKLGDNTKALLIARGLSEMARYGAAMGAEILTFFGMVGIGDLLATCASSHSRNLQTGRRLAQGETREQIQKSMFMVAEGVKTTRAVYLHSKSMGLTLPIVNTVHGVLYDGMGIQAALDALMSIEVDREFSELERIQISFQSS
ncbi:MAG: NAD(P)H-dependent glycerol-3-phosphate dehydrogenase [Pseudomonadota bacterium]